MNETLLQTLALILPLVVAIVFHEVAHGYAAKLLGDATAQEQRRLSLNPLRHVDPFGTIILPALLKLSGAPMFGWAKPVPVNKWRLRNPRRDMMLVGAAGPGANLAMAALGAVALGALVGQTAPDVAAAGQVFAYLEQGYTPQIDGAVSFGVVSLTFFLLINIFLALFNLLPVPPLDGSHIVEGLLPRAAAARYARLRNLGLVLVILLVIVLPWLAPGLDIVGRFVIPPVEWALGHYIALARGVAGA